MKVYAAVVILYLALVANVAATGAASSYGSSIPAPPCPKNYLFSCQPSLSPAPCSQPAPSYGSAGAYSDNVPTYVSSPLTFNGYQGLQGYQGIQGYNGYGYPQGAIQY